MKDIWGKDHSGLVLKEIAVSVCSFSLILSFSFLHLGWIEQNNNNNDDDDEQLVHMCVAMGIKPRVHYQIGYPCKDIADLFEDEVSHDK